MSRKSSYFECKRVIISVDMYCQIIMYKGVGYLSKLHDVCQKISIEGQMYIACIKSFRNKTVSN